MGEQEKFVIKTIGLIYPTIVEYNKRTLTTQGLSITELCKAWRKNFNFSPTEKIEVYFENENEYSIVIDKGYCRHIPYYKSIRMLLEEQGFICKLLQDVSKDLNKD